MICLWIRPQKEVGDNMILDFDSIYVESCSLSGQSHFMLSIKSDLDWLPAIFSINSIYLKWVFFFLLFVWIGGLNITWVRKQFFLLWVFTFSNALLLFYGIEHVKILQIIVYLQQLLNFQQCSQILSRFLGKKKLELAWCLSLKAFTPKLDICQTPLRLKKSDPWCCLKRRLKTHDSNFLFTDQNSNVSRWSLLSNGVTGLCLWDSFFRSAQQM